MTDTKELPYEVICYFCGQLFEIDERPVPGEPYLCKDCIPTDTEVIWPDDIDWPNDVNDPGASDELEK